MENNLQQQIINATQAVFDTMLMLPVTSGVALPDKVYLFNDSISGMLGFSGDVQGMLTIHCPQQIAFCITGQLLGMEVDGMDEDVKDTIGEMANMILGGIKDAFLERGTDISLAVPTVMSGRSYRVKTVDYASWTTVPFYLDDGEFLVELKLKTLD
ncbi:MAG: chemotaxis protein CheX [Desulfuromonadaceae bacterium]|nr:chemotaxis protein CheX [Desulfuromonas sp.]MDY0184973.1 chemotaxis protein CheX [Desulfuromonadaceae bacterium]